MIPSYPLLAATLVLGAALVRLVAELVVRRRGGRIAAGPTLLAAAALVVLTVVFDNVMIAAGLFWYPEEHLSGLRIGLAPVEDLSYPIATALALPGVWALLGGGGHVRS